MTKKEDFIRSIIRMDKSQKEKELNLLSESELGIVMVKMQMKSSKGKYFDKANNSLAGKNKK